MADKYMVRWNYKAGAYGPWNAGDTVELSPAEAEAINRDSPGVLVPYEAPRAAPEARAVDAPPIDRAMRAPGRRRASEGREG